MPSNIPNVEELETMQNIDPNYSMYDISDEDVIVYDSHLVVPNSFWVWSICWCGCCDPSYYITDTTVQANVCAGCGKTRQSLLFDNIWDVKRDQSCCCWCCNCCPCLDDVGDILLSGHAGRLSKTLSMGVDADDGEFRLKNVFRSKEIFDKLADIIQEKHAEFRLSHRNLGVGVMYQKKRVTAEAHGHGTLSL